MAKLRPTDREERGWSKTQPAADYMPKHDPAPQPDVPTSNNGSVVRLDKWRFRDDRRLGIALATRLPDKDEATARGFSRRISEAMGTLLDDSHPQRRSRALAVLDHLWRRQREEQLDAILPVRKLSAALEHYDRAAGRHSPFLPDPRKIAEEMAWVDADGALAVRYTHPSKMRFKSRGLSGDEWEYAEDCFRRIQQSLTDATELAVWQWLGACMFRHSKVSAERLAVQLGCSLSTIYRVKRRLIARTNQK